MDHISSVPPEILFKIFQFLLIDDRKNVRLTCRLWYQECSRFQLIKNEKFVFRKREDKDCIQHYGAGLQSTCKTWRTYFEFHGLSLAQFPSTVWRNCGVRIQYLFLYNCDFDENTFANIIFHCSRLIRFHFMIRFAYPDDSEEQCKFLFTYPSPATPKLDGLIRSGMKREKLTSFEIYPGDNVQVSTVIYRKLFKIFPRLCYYGHGESMRRSLLTSQYYALPEGNLNPSGEWAFPPQRVDADYWLLPTLKFKEYRTSFIDFSHYRPDILEFFSQQTELENVHVRILVPYPDSYRPSILFHLLKSLPKLKRLNYNTDMSKTKTCFSVERFEEFLRMTSGLESLLLTLIGINLELPIEDTWQLLPSIKYTRLKKLFLGRDTDETIIFEILSRCSSSLQVLGLDSSINHEITQKIFETHTDLQLFLVYNLAQYIHNTSCQYSSNVSLEPTTYSLSRLRNLIRLEITTMTRPEFDIFLTEFNCPDLRFFQFPRYFDFAKNNEHEKLRWIIDAMLRTLSRKAPFLEILSFENRIPLGAIELANSCRQLKWLQIILLSRGSLKAWIAANRSYMKRLFNECRSLRWLAGEDSPIMYYYDRTSNELIEYSDNVCLFYQKYNLWP